MFKKVNYPSSHCNNIVDTCGIHIAYVLADIPTRLPDLYINVNYSHGFAICLT